MPTLGDFTTLGTNHWTSLPGTNGTITISLRHDLQGMSLVAKIIPKWNMNILHLDAAINNGKQQYLANTKMFHQDRGVCSESVWYWLVLNNFYRVNTQVRGSSIPGGCGKVFNCRRRTKI